MLKIFMEKSCQYMERYSETFHEILAVKSERMVISHTTYQYLF